MSHSQPRNPHRRARPPRPLAVFTPADGRPANVPEAICLLAQAVTQLINVDSEGELGQDEGRRVVTGGDVAAAVRYLLASEHGRALLFRLLAPELLPLVKQQIPKIGYAHLRVQEDEAQPRQN